MIIFGRMEASHDTATSDRTLMDIREGGNCKAFASVKRFETHALTTKAIAKGPARVRKRLLAHTLDTELAHALRISNFGHLPCRVAFLFFRRAQNLPKAIDIGCDTPEAGFLGMPLVTRAKHDKVTTCSRLPPNMACSLEKSNQIQPNPIRVVSRTLLMYSLSLWTSGPLVHQTSALQAALDAH